MACDNFLTNPAAVAVKIGQGAPEQPSETLDKCVQGMYNNNKQYVGEKALCRNTRW